MFPCPVVLSDFKCVNFLRREAFISLCLIINSHFCFIRCVYCQWKSIQLVVVCKTGRHAWKYNIWICAEIAHGNAFWSFLHRTVSRCIRIIQQRQVCLLRKVRLLIRRRLLCIRIIKARQRSQCFVQSGHFFYFFLIPFFIIQISKWKCILILKDWSATRLSNRCIYLLRCIVSGSCDQIFRSQQRTPDIVIHIEVYEITGQCFRSVHLMISNQWRRIGAHIHRKSIVALTHSIVFWCRCIGFLDTVYRIILLFQHSHSFFCPIIVIFCCHLISGRRFTMPQRRIIQNKQLTYQNQQYSSRKNSVHFFYRSSNCK